MFIRMRDGGSTESASALPWTLVSYAQYKVLTDWTRGTGYHRQRADLLAQAIDEFAAKWLLEN